jgi:hypothetical protein
LLTGFTVVPIAENRLRLDKQATNVGLHSGIPEVLQFAVDQCLQGSGVNWHPQRYREMLQLESLSSVEGSLRVGLSGRWSGGSRSPHCPEQALSRPPRDAHRAMA